ncbi:MAG TPA: hypothetical protein VHS28_08230, partial [Chloroflexota bacterium]|nr:hypothetical protein [Chloroflexota bacterium]
MTNDPNLPGENAGDQAGELPEQAKQTTKRKWRRWPFVVAGVVVLLVVLILLAPAILSMGWARSWVVGRINSGLNGRVQVS